MLRPKTKSCMKWKNCSFSVRLFSFVDWLEFTQVVKGFKIQTLCYTIENTGYTQKNGAVLEVNKKFTSHLRRAQSTSSAATAIQVSHALPAVRFLCLLRGQFPRWRRSRKMLSVSSVLRCPDLRLRCSSTVAVHGLEKMHHAWCVFSKPCTKLTLHSNHRSGHLKTEHTESLFLLRHHLGNWPRSKHEKRTAGSAWEIWTVAAANGVRCARVRWEINFSLTFETASFICKHTVYPHSHLFAMKLNAILSLKTNARHWNASEVLVFLLAVVVFHPSTNVNKVSR